MSKEEVKILLLNEEFQHILNSTRRKCEVKELSDDYFKILLESELEDYIARKRINKDGKQNFLQQTMQNPLTLAAGDV